MKFPTNLTKRERQVIPYLISGATRNEIASHFGISAETVKSHTTRILRKFDALNIRDFFKTINLYQQFFGIGGLGTQTHILDSELDYYLEDDRKSLRLVRKFEYLVMSEPVTFIKRVYSDADSQPMVEFLVDFPITTTYVQENDRHIFTAEFEQPFLKGSRFKVTEKLTLSDHHSSDSGYDRLHFSTPFDRRHLRYHFPINDVPQSIACDVRLGGIRAQMKNISSELRDNVFHVWITNFENPYTVMITWKYGTGT